VADQKTSIRKLRFIIFLKDVAQLAFTSFGGPQVHIVMFKDLLVIKRAYLNEEEFMDLYALAQVLPGPASTQTITAIGFRLGGPSLAYLTLLIWILPAISMMAIFAMLTYYFQKFHIELVFIRFLQPIAVGFVCYAAVKIVQMTILTKTGFFLGAVSAISAYFIHSPWVFPISVVMGGLVSGALKFDHHTKEETKPIKIQWGNFILFWGVLIALAILGGITRLLDFDMLSRSIRLFENFYRNSSFIFGGGQVLVPVLYTEFVHFIKYLSRDEFLSGFGLAQIVPGPVFAFATYVGVLSMREYGIVGQLVGGLVASAGIFLPGTFIMFFVIRFWDDLKRYRVVKASLEGIHASGAGLVVAASIILLEPQGMSLINSSIVWICFVLLMFTKLPPMLLIIIGLIAGFIF